VSGGILADRMVLSGRAPVRTDRAPCDGIAGRLGGGAARTVGGGVVLLANPGAEDRWPNSSKLSIDLFEGELASLASSGPKGPIPAPAAGGGVTLLLSWGC